MRAFRIKGELVKGSTIYTVPVGKIAKVRLTVSNKSGLRIGTTTVPENFYFLDGNNIKWSGNSTTAGYTIENGIYILEGESIVTYSTSSYGANVDIIIFEEDL